MTDDNQDLEDLDADDLHRQTRLPNDHQDDQEDILDEDDYDAIEAFLRARAAAILRGDADNPDDDVAETEPPDAPDLVGVDPDDPGDQDDDQELELKDEDLEDELLTEADLDDPLNDINDQDDNSDRLSTDPADDFDILTGPLADHH